MNSLTVLFINCTLKKFPEVSNTEALWTVVANYYHPYGCQIQQRRTVDGSISLETLDEGTGDEFLPLFEQMRRADILIVGIPVSRGGRSPEYHAFIERLHKTCHAHLDPATGQPPLYNRVIGLVVVGDASEGTPCIAQTCYDFSQLGCVNPPNNVVAWFQPMDTAEEFIEAKGTYAESVNREARLLVEHSVMMARLLRQTPLSASRWNAIREAGAIAKAVTVETATLMTPKAIRTPDNPDCDGIDYHHITKRIWTVMQEGMHRGFVFKILSLDDKIFRAERNGKGFIYKIYPGHFSFRRQYDDYDYEQSKSRKLERMQQHGLPVPVSYGTFKTATDIPGDLPFPIVAKPDSGSLSQNVFPNLQTVSQLQHAATRIVANGDVIKLESHVSGQNYRVLIINHQYAGCVERRPANVVGDGKHTILDLFQLRNQEPGRGDRYETHTTLHHLVFDDTSRRLLQEKGYTLDTRLPNGERCYLQTKITASTGADYVDCTDDLHPSIIKSCIDFSHQFSTLTLGFDLITPNLTRPLAETGGAFNEYNFLPYVDLHEHCNIGQKRPVCRLMWDYIDTHAEQLVTADFKAF